MDRNIKKVLIVEDDSLIAKNLSLLLQKNGFEPVAVISKGRKIAEETVKKRLSNIYSKLGIKNKYQLIEYLHTNFVPDK